MSEADLQAKWAAVDAYISESLVGADFLLDDVLAACRKAGLPEINVPPNQGKLLMLLAQIQGARRILEIGTLGGYSTIWLARALPADGELVTLESEPRHAEVARRNLDAAGVLCPVEIKVGPALETLPTLQGPFDFIFIDADKASYPAYFEWALRLSRSGSVIVADNVVRAGRVLDPKGEPNAEGIRRMNALIGDEPQVSATAVQTVGVKGWDGFCLIRVS
jgi:predicted O-methyltransferase YrrM